MMLRRILRVFLLDKDVFEEVGQDSSANWQALIIVTIVAFFGAISSAIRAFILSIGFGAGNALIGAAEGLAGDIIPFDLPDFSPISAFFSSFAGVYVAWLLWALVTWLIGEFLLKGDAGWGEMARIIGFSMSPRIIGALGFIPGIGWIAALIGWIWAIVAGYVGIRQGLQLSMGKTILTIILSLIVVFLVNHFVVNAIFTTIF